ncbi:MAG: purine-nucleoside phosphorylase [Firmicutes bacterium]|nr:purine-nucleoside phosphorylase [Bacillota bacterium]
MTPHIEAKKEDIAKVVLMPGDPLRAKMIAETFLENPRLVNQVRNIYAYTGTYKGKEVTVMASGMGMPSMGIYSYELFKFYDVDSIIRVGSAGAYTKDLNLYDVILVNASYSDSSYAKVQSGNEDVILHASSNLNFYLQDAANNLNIPLTIANIYSTDVFYKKEDNYKELYNKYGCLAVDMESFALFQNANLLNKKAACLLTISDNLETKEETTSLERQNSFKKMIEIALESIL